MSAVGTSHQLLQCSDMPAVGCKPEVTCHPAKVSRLTWFNLRLGPAPKNVPLTTKRKRLEAASGGGLFREHVLARRNGPSLGGHWDRFSQTGGLGGAIRQFDRTLICRELNRSFTGPFCSGRYPFWPVPLRGHGLFAPSRLVRNAVSSRGKAVVLPSVSLVAIGARPKRVSCIMPKKIAPTVRAVECAVCGQQMKHLADMELTAAFPASRIYRCYGCDHVLQREW